VLVGRFGGVFLRRRCLERRFGEGGFRRGGLTSRFKRSFLSRVEGAKFEADHKFWD